MKKPPFFIVGCPRSGTTLMRNLLRSHPHLTIPNESHFIPSFYKAYGDPRNKAEALSLAGRILRLHWVRMWKVSLQVTDFADARSFEEILDRLFSVWCRREKKKRWGDKTPEYVRNITTLREICANCKIIHMIRDGRDVALSWLATGFQPQNLFMAMSDWRYAVQEGMRQGSIVGLDGYLEVQYEKLISEPQQTMSKVCEFLDEPFSEQVLQLNPMDEEYLPRLIGKRHTADISNDSIVSTNFGKWKKAMSQRKTILCESVAGDLLDDLGYETMGTRRRITVFEVIFWCLHNLILLFWDRLLTGQKKQWLRGYLSLRLAMIRYHFHNY